MDHSKSTHLSENFNREKFKADRKFLLSPSLVRRVENFFSPESPVSINTSTSRPTERNELIKQPIPYKRPPFEFISTHPPPSRTGTNSQFIPNHAPKNEFSHTNSQPLNTNHIDAIWDPKWKILSNEHPNNFKREYITDLLSMRPKDVSNIEHSYPIQNTNNFSFFNDLTSNEKAIIDIHNRNTSHQSSFKGNKIDSGSYAKRFEPGNSYVMNKRQESTPLNLRDISNQSTNEKNSTMKTIWAVNPAVTHNTNSPYDSSDDIQTISNPNQGNMELKGHNELHFGTTLLIKDSLTPEKLCHKTPAENKNSSLEFPTNNIYSQPLGSNNITHSTSTDSLTIQNSDKLAFLKRRHPVIETGQFNQPESNLKESKSNYKDQNEYPQRRNHSTYHNQSGYKQKKNTYNSNLNATTNQIYTNNIEESSSLHNYQTRDKNFLISKYSSNSANRANDKESKTPKQSYTLKDCDPQTLEAEIVSNNSQLDSSNYNHDNLKLKNNHDSISSTNSKSTQPTRRAIGEQKTIYIETKDLQDFPLPLTVKWLNQFTSRLKISTTQWLLNVEALLDARRLAKFHPEIIFNSNLSPNSLTGVLSLRSVVLDVIKLLNSPRSSLAKNASLCLVDFYFFGGKKMDLVNEEIVPSCLKKSSQNSTDFLSDAAYCVLVQMCRSVTPTKALTTIINATHKSRHQGFRTVGVKCLAVLIDRLKQTILRTKELPTLIRFLITTSHEASSETRNASRIAISVLMRNIGNKLDQLSELGYLSSTEIAELEDCFSRSIISDERLVLDPFTHKSIF